MDMSKFGSSQSIKDKIGATQTSGKTPVTGHDPKGKQVGPAPKMPTKPKPKTTPSKVSVTKKPTTLASQGKKPMAGVKSAPDKVAEPKKADNAKPTKKGTLTPKQVRQRARLVKVAARKLRAAKRRVEVKAKRKARKERR